MNKPGFDNEKYLKMQSEHIRSRIDKFGRMIVEFRTKKTPEQRINKMQIMKLLSITCERDFEMEVNEQDIFRNCY